MNREIIKLSSHLELHLHLLDRVRRRRAAQTAQPRARDPLRVDPREGDAHVIQRRRHLSGGVR